jgi:hypothetical protein
MDLQPLKVAGSTSTGKTARTERVQPIPDTRIPEAAPYSSFQVPSCFPDKYIQNKELRASETTYNKVFVQPKVRIGPEV